MGEAKRRSAAPTHTETTAGQILRKFNEAMAELPPAPMNGANEIEVSPADFARLCVATEASPFDGRTFSGLRATKSEMLPDGIFIGRRNGKAVWSNAPWMQDAIDADFTPWGPDPAPAPGPSPIGPTPRRLRGGLSKNGE